MEINERYMCSNELLDIVTPADERSSAERKIRIEISVHFSDDIDIEEASHSKTTRAP